MNNHDDDYPDSLSAWVAAETARIRHTPVRDGWHDEIVKAATAQLRREPVSAAETKRRNTIGNLVAGIVVFLLLIFILAFITIWTNPIAAIIASLSGVVGIAALFLISWLELTRLRDGHGQNRG